MRQADRLPICIGTSWLAADRFPDAHRIYAQKRSMTATLAHFGVRDYQRRSTSIVAATVDLADAMLLDLSPAEPVLVVDSIDVDPDGRPAVTSRARFAAERVEFRIES